MRNRDIYPTPTARTPIGWPASAKQRRALGTLALVIAVPVAAGSIALGYPPLLGAVIAALGLRQLWSDPTATAGP